MDISTTPPVVTSAAVVGDIDVTRPSRAFDDFYGECGAAVAKALAMTLNDTELAEDATNEAMTRAYQRWSKISGYDNPAAWVYRVGLNWALSWKRRRRRERERPVKFVADYVEVTHRDDQFDAALAELSVNHRAVIVCRIYLDLSVEESAVALGTAAGTVKSRLARALEHLRQSLDLQEGVAQ